MSLSHGSRIITDGLVFHIDPANKKNYNYDMNLYPYSEAFSNAAWTSTKSSITSDQNLTDPFGGNNASRMYADTGPYTTRYDQVTVVQGETYTMSLYVKYVDQRYITLVQEGSDSSVITFDFQNETISGSGTQYVSNKATDVGNGWWRIENTFTNASDTSARVLIWIGQYSGTDYSGTSVDIFGAQIERREIAGPYVKTTGSAVTEPTTISSTVGSFDGTINTGRIKYSHDTGGLKVTNTSNNGVSYSDQPDASAVVFDGTNFTIQHTFKMTQAATDNYFSLANNIIAMGTATTYNYATQIKYNDNTKMQFVKRTSPESLRFHDFTVGSSLLNRTVMITFVIDQLTDVVYCYENDTLLGSTTILGDPIEPRQDGDDPFRLLVAHGSAVYAFVGELYDLKIYNRDLSPQEIKRNFYAIRGRFGI